MKGFIVRLLCAALLATSFALPLAAQENDKAAAQEKAAFEIMRAGGNVLVMRHANSPSGQKAPVGLTEGCQLQPGRGLDAIGLYQARSLGELMREKEIPILKAYTSDMCRAWDTARLVAGGAPVTPHASQKTTDPQAIAAFKKEIEAELAANPATNIILSNHSNIAPLYGAKAEEGEEEVPSGAIFVIRPPEWETIERIEYFIDATPATITVE
jgi:phosphohistidine phosphatase SixA